MKNGDTGNIDLYAYAFRTEDGRWYFGDPAHPHSERDAEMIVRACHILEVPVTDVLTSEAWLRIVTGLARLDEAVRGLEAAVAMVLARTDGTGDR